MVGLKYNHQKVIRGIIILTFQEYLTETYISDEMFDYFKVRTDKHIALVKDALMTIQDTHPDWKLDFEHDASKFKEPEVTPYIWITWMYHEKYAGRDFKYPLDIEPKTRAATLQHITTNRHHPEYWAKNFKDNIDPNDRDKAVAPVDVSAMPDYAIGEMVSDWVGMGRERGNSGRSWYNKVNCARYLFSKHQQEVIDGLLRLFEK